MPTYSIQDLKDLVIQNYPDQYLGLIGPPEEREVLNAMIDYMAQIQSVVNPTPFIYDPDTSYAADSLVVYEDFWYRSLQADNLGNTPLLSGTSAFWKKLPVAVGGISYWAAAVYLNDPAIVLHPVSGGYDLYLLDRSIVGMNPFDSQDFNLEYLDGKWKSLTGSNKFVRYDIDSQGLSSVQKGNARKNIGIEVHNDLPGIPGSPDGIHLSQAEYENLFLDFDTELLDGGLVQWSLSGFTFFVSAVIYKILGDILQIIFSSTVTLDASYASNDRTDALYVDADQVVKVRKGEDIPASPQPQIDPLTEVLITYINVPAGSTEPIITDLVMYAENVEYTVSFVGTGTGVSNSTDAPHGGSVSIKYTAVQNNGTVRLTGAGDEDLTDFVTLGFWIKLIAAMNAGHSITAQFFDSAGVAVTNELVLPILKNTLDYQFIAVNISSFTITSNDFRRLDFKFKRTSGPSSFAGFYLDDVKLETGVTQPTPGDDGENGWSPVLSIETDGARRVQKVVDWVGGTGTKPAINVYVGSTGFVTDIASAVDIRGSEGDPGDNGLNGWTPVLAIVSDGERRVHQVVDWVGGTGTEPTTGLYIGVSGLVPDIEDGVDIRGAQGSTGDPGEFLGGDYLFDTTTSAADPGAGKVRFNNATLAGITAIYIDVLTNDAVDIQNILKSLKLGDVIYLQNQTDSTKWARFKLTADATDSTGYFTLAVEYVNGSATLPANNDLLTALIGMQNESAGGGADTNAVHYNAADGKNDAEKAQARENLGMFSNLNPTVVTLGFPRDYVRPTNFLIGRRGINNDALYSMAAGKPGEMVLFYSDNTASSYGYTLAHEDATSVAENRLYLPGGNYKLYKGQWVIFTYDPVLQRWVLGTPFSLANNYFLGTNVFQAPNTAEAAMRIFSAFANNTHELAGVYFNTTEKGQVWKRIGIEFGKVIVAEAGISTPTGATPGAVNFVWNSGSSVAFTYQQNGTTYASGGPTGWITGVGWTIRNGYGGATTITLAANGRVFHSRSAAATESIRRDEKRLYEVVTVTTAGAINDQALTDGTFNYRFTAATSISGFGNGEIGRTIDIDNVTGATLTLNHENTGSIAANRIKLIGAADLVIPIDGKVTLKYCTGSRWELVSKNF